MTHLPTRVNVAAEQGAHPAAAQSSLLPLTRAWGLKPTGTDRPPRAASCVPASLGPVPGFPETLIEPPGISELNMPPSVRQLGIS